MPPFDRSSPMSRIDSLAPILDPRKVGVVERSVEKERTPRYFRRMPEALGRSCARSAVLNSDSALVGPRLGLSNLPLILSPIGFGFAASVSPCLCGAIPNRTFILHARP